MTEKEHYTETRTAHSYDKQLLLAKTESLAIYSYSFSRCFAAIAIHDYSIRVYNRKKYLQELQDVVHFL